MEHRVADLQVTPVHGFETTETAQRPSASTTDRKVRWSRYGHEQHVLVGIASMLVGVDVEVEKTAARGIPFRAPRSVLGTRCRLAAPRAIRDLH